MNSKLAYQTRKKQFIALCIFGVVALVGKVSFGYYQARTESRFPDIELAKPSETQVILSDFDPNELDGKQWAQLGFTEKQVATILKYKEIVGGSFKDKDQLKKCYAISEEKYREIEPYVLLPQTASGKAFRQNNFEKKELKIQGKFNPDFYTEKDWQNIGFTDKQAAAIVKYKKYLGGSFVSKEKFKECFIINDENYKKLNPYLILPEKTPENFENNRKFAEKPKTKYFDFNPNELNGEGWQKLGFSEKQAAVILNFRDKKFKGNFKTVEDLKSCIVISEEKLAELKPYIRLSEVTKNAASAPKTEITKTDFGKTDLNKITYAQLIEFGFNEKSAGSFIGFRKKLGGFADKNQILETYNIDGILAEKLLKSASFSTANIQKYSLTEAPEEWLKNHPYFRYYADRIIYLRVSNPSESEIFKKLKAKPEDVAKMRLYLK